MYKNGPDSMFIHCEYYKSQMKIQKKNGQKLVFYYRKKPSFAY